MLRLCEVKHKFNGLGPPPFSPGDLLNDRSKKWSKQDKLPHLAPRRGGMNGKVEQLPSKADPKHQESFLPIDHPQHHMHCPHIHGIFPSCHAIPKNPKLLVQACGPVSRAEVCWFGHDLESARYESWKWRNQHKWEGQKVKEEEGAVFRDHQTGRWWRRKSLDTGFDQEREKMMIKDSEVPAGAKEEAHDEE